LSIHGVERAHLHALVVAEKTKVDNGFALDLPGTSCRGRDAGVGEAHFRAIEHHAGPVFGAGQFGQGITRLRRRCTGGAEILARASPEQQHSKKGGCTQADHFLESAASFFRFGRRTTPFSVTIAVTSLAGVTSKAGLATATPSGAQRMPA